MTSTLSLIYRFAPEVRSISRDNNRLTIEVDGWKSLTFNVAKQAHADAIQALEGEGATLEHIEKLASETDDVDEGCEVVSYYIERFSQARLIHWELKDESGQLAYVTPLAKGYRPLSEKLPSQLLSLCRFAYLRHTPEGMLLESGAVRAHMLLTPTGLEVLARSLMQPHLASRDEMAGLLWRLGFFDVEDRQEDDSRKCWEFHDLLMHETSRFNRDGPRGGATYRFTDKFPSLPAIKPPMLGERIDLPAIDVATLQLKSGSLDAVQMRRKSIRTYADQPIALSTLAEFLWRVARTTAKLSISGPQELMSRAYPAGGSINELEFYVAVRRCDGLQQAFYHYDSHGHALVALANTQKIANQILGRSGGAMALKSGDQLPDVCIVVSSRLPRLAWKYERMAYRASLLHAGVVIELMYLVATDMNLAPCANGSGDSRLFEQATGIDSFEETSVAEFCLGLPLQK
jgi:SagB-type dehydrogenase family enzyme